LEDPQLVATAASFGLSQVMGLPDAFDPTIKLLALLFSAFIGVVFGYFPARRAAQMDPIEALRHEQADDKERPCEPGRQRTAVKKSGSRTGSRSENGNFGHFRVLDPRVQGDRYVTEQTTSHRR